MRNLKLALPTLARAPFATAIVLRQVGGMVVIGGAIGLAGASASKAAQNDACRAANRA